MANEQWPKNGQEKLWSNWVWSSTNENPEAFDVLKQNLVNPELFWNEEAILEDLKKNHVDVKDVKAFWYDSKLITIDLPAIWEDFQWKKVCIIIPNISEEQCENDKLQWCLLSLEDLSDILSWILSYMKSYWVEIDWNFSFEYSEDFKDFHELWVLDIFLNLLPNDDYRRFMLKKSRMFARQGKYLLFDSDNIEWYREEYPLINFLNPSFDENILYQVEWSHYDNINLLDWKGSHADEIMWKMDELKSADLVLVFRNNDKYSAMISKLEQLVKYRYGWQIYCITIPKGTEKNQLTEQDKEVLAEVLTNCKCMTDYTVSEWTWIETEKIEDVPQDGEMTEQQNEFLNVARSIESYYEDQWIDTVYILSSYRIDWQWTRKLLLEHGWFCQKEDGTIYYIKAVHDQDEEHYNDAKRFWKNLFKKMNVKFIESNQLLRKTWLWKKYIFDYDKAKWALAIVDYHFTEACECFENEGWKVITFGWDSFWKWIWWGDFWEALAEKICKRI